MSKTPSYTSNLLSRGHRQSLMKRRRSRLTSWDLNGSHDLLEQEHDLAFIRSVVKLQRVQCPVESPPPTPRAPRGSQAPPAHTAACCSRRRDTPSAYKLTTAYPLFAQAYRLSAYVYRHFGPELFVDSKGISSSAPLTSHRG